MRKKWTTASFIEKANQVHQGKYSYSLTQYTGIDNKVIIICPVHGLFEQIAYNHIKGFTCKACSCKSVKHLYNGVEQGKKFIKDATEKWNGYYDYSKVIFTKMKDKVEIICPLHGSFFQVADTHLKSECIKCGLKKMFDGNRLSTEDFVKKSTLIHKGFYCYKRAVYTGNKKKLTITCPLHGEFTQLAYNHLGGRGCRECKNSRRWNYLSKIY
jgi:hypothetical protein